MAKEQSLDEALAALDAKQKAEREKLFEKHLEPLRKEKAEKEAQIDELSKRCSEIDREISRITGKPLIVAKKAAAGERQRRSEDDLKADARRIADFIKSKGQDGANGGEIKKVAKPKAGMSVVDFVKQFAGEKVTMRGEKAAARYYA